VVGNFSIIRKTAMAAVSHKPDKPFRLKSWGNEKRRRRHRSSSLFIFPMSWTGAEHSSTTQMAFRQREFYLKKK
jgi:hypothetical protein